MKSVPCVRGRGLFLLLLLAAVPACLPLHFLAPHWLRVGAADNNMDVGTPAHHDEATRASPRRGSRVGGVRGGRLSPWEEDGGGEGGWGGRSLEEDPHRNLVSGGTPVPRGEYPFLAVVHSNSVLSEETNSTYVVRSSI